MNKLLNELNTPWLTILVTGAFVALCVYCYPNPQPLPNHNSLINQMLEDFAKDKHRRNEGTKLKRAKDLISVYEGE